LFAPDAELTSTAPFRVRPTLRGQDVHDAIRELRKDVRMDLTHKQLTRERAVWTVRIEGSPSDTRGRIEAEFEDGRVVRVQLGPAAQG
jgi:DNA topoisomerase IA